MNTVLLFSLTAMANPTLVAVTTVMLLLPNPRRLMVGYLIGALVMSISIGLAIVFAFQGAGAVQTAKKTVNPIVDIVLGVLLLLIAALLASGRPGEVRQRRRARKAETGEKKTPRWQRILIERGSVRIAIVVGALLTLPGASYLAALHGIIKLDASTTVTVLVVLLVNVIMLAPLEVPLIAFTVAPEATPGAIARVRAWFARNGVRAAIYGATIVGTLLIVRGVIEAVS
jgi:Sap-like sulfolipid-1-addressing protein